MIPGIVLAGGKSSRMGSPKALLPIGSAGENFLDRVTGTLLAAGVHDVVVVVGADAAAIRAGSRPRSDRKSTRLNSSHGYISYAVFCLKKKRQYHVNCYQ